MGATGIGNTYAIVLSGKGSGGSAKIPELLRLPQDCNNHTKTAEQLLPMLLADLKVIMDYLDSPEGISKYSKTCRLFFKAYGTTAFTLWTW